MHTHYQSYPPGATRSLAASLVTALLLLGSLQVRSIAQQGGERSELAAARRLVQQLGDDDYAAREQANQELLELGIAATSALQEGARHADREIRYRSARLLAFIEDVDFQRRLESFAAGVDHGSDYGLPGWSAYRQLAGDTDESRALFVNMQREDAELLRAVEQGAEETGKLLQRRLRDYQHLAAQLDQQVPLGRIAASLFAAVQEDVRVSSPVASYIYNLCYQPTFQAAIESGGARPTLRKMLGRWILRSTDVTISHGLMLALRFDLQEGLPLAERVLRDPHAANFRQFAILTVAKLGDERHVPLLERLLTDETYCLGQRINDAHFETQIRDIALAAALYLLGQDPKKFGFERLELDPQYVLQVNTIGFATATQRELAFSKWRAFRAKQQDK